MKSYIGDPDFVDVPMDGLLSKSYAEERRAAIDPRQGNAPEMPYLRRSVAPHGNARQVMATRSGPDVVAGGLPADTSYASVVDRWGNAFSATPSDSFGTSPIIPGLGFHRIVPRITNSGSTRTIPALCSPESALDSLPIRLSPCAMASH